MIREEFNEELLVARWKEEVRFNASWGSIMPAGKLNGSSGRWVNDHVLAPFGLSREDACLTDCLDTYRCSRKVAARLQDTYSLFACNHRLPCANLESHPTEDEIVTEALANHQTRLLQEIKAAQPTKIVTLGNAALRVFTELVTVISHPAPRKLSLWPDHYGRSIQVELPNGSAADWWPLAHPGAPLPYQQAHKLWQERFRTRKVDN